MKIVAHWDHHRNRNEMQKKQYKEYYETLVYLDNILLCTQITTLSFQRIRKVEKKVK